FLPHRRVSCACLPDAVGEFVRSSDARKGPKEVAKADGSSTPATSRESKGRWRRLHSTFCCTDLRGPTSNKQLCPAVGAYALQVVWVPQPTQVHRGSSNPFSGTAKHR